MAVFVVKGRRYPVPERYTLGEQRTLKRISGRPASAWDNQRDAGDPDVMAAMLLVAMQRVDPNVMERDIDALESGDVVFEGDEPEPEAAPVPPAEDVARGR